MDSYLRKGLYQAEVAKLHRVTPERQLFVFFRNNHFSTLLKKNGELYLLVTDMGYLRESAVVWERLIEVSAVHVLFASPT